jgi:hypothetical protein
MRPRHFGQDRFEMNQEGGKAGKGYRHNSRPLHREVTAPAHEPQHRIASSRFSCLPAFLIKIPIDRVPQEA